MRRTLLLLSLVAAACTPRAAPPDPSEAVLPTFSPVDELAGGMESPSPATTGAPSSTAVPMTPGAAPTDPPGPHDAPARPGAPRTTPPAPQDDALTGTITDAGADVRAGTPLQDPPDSVDLRQLVLLRGAAGYEVRVEMAAPVPERREGERITNVATFYDVDGDGELDYQVYATSTPDGWGSAYFDHVRGETAYADDDEVDVTVEDGFVVMRFPLGHLGDATGLQWSAATQWGTFEELQTGTEARDRAPDDGRGVRWPGEA